MELKGNARIRSSSPIPSTRYSSSSVSPILSGRSSISLQLRLQSQWRNGRKEEDATTWMDISATHSSPPPARISCWLLVTIATIVLGSSTVFGFHLGVLNSPQKMIKASFGRNSSSGMMAASFSNLEMNLALAIFSIGGMCGDLPAGQLADYLGRKNTLLLNNIINLLGVALQVTAIHPIMFIVGRFTVGINGGINTVVVPIYIAEISPIRLRGVLGGLNPMAITVCILLSEILGTYHVFGRSDSEFHAWRILFAIPAVFSIFQLLVLPWCPPSPRFLFLKQRRHEAAVEALIKLRGKSADIASETLEMQEELEDLDTQEKVHLSQLITVPYLRRALFLSIVLHISQHCGINGLVNYSTKVFHVAGLESPDDATVFIGVTVVLFTFISLFLVEVLGRRSLMLYGLSGVSLSFTVMTSMLCFQDGFYGRHTKHSGMTPPGIILVGSSIFIVIFYALGPGTVPWMMVSELFLQEARPCAVSIATVANWMANFTVALTFPYILECLYPYGTIIFAILCAIMWIPLYLMLPETKGKSVEDITHELKNPAWMKHR